jgi:hypothetical protein
MLNSRSENIVSDQYKMLGVANFGALKFKMKNILMWEVLWHVVAPNLA